MGKAFFLKWMMRIKLSSYYASKTSHLRLIIGVNSFPALGGLICGYMTIAISTPKAFQILAININVQMELPIILKNRKII